MFTIIIHEKQRVLIRIFNIDKTTWFCTIPWPQSSTHFCECFTKLPIPSLQPGVATAAHSQWNALLVSSTLTNRPPWSWFFALENQKKSHGANPATMVGVRAPPSHALWLATAPHRALRETMHYHAKWSAPPNPQQMMSFLADDWAQMMSNKVGSNHCLQSINSLTHPRKHCGLPWLVWDFWLPYWLQWSINKPLCWLPLKFKL